MSNNTKRAQLDDQPAESPHHDVLVFTPEQERSPWWFWRFPVVKKQVDASTGDYQDQPELWNYEDSGLRKTALIAKPNLRHQVERPRGPAFSTLPVKPEPGPTSITTCYLVNAENLNYVNPWTIDEWNDVERDEVQQACDWWSDQNTIEAVLAGPCGTAFHIKLDDVNELACGERLALRTRAGQEVGSFERIDLRYEMEIWNQLRNGCVAGSALLQREDRVVPLVNLTTLAPQAPHNKED